MMRCSHEELVERWSQTYRDDGYEIRADGVNGVTETREIEGVMPDIEATRKGGRVFVLIIDSPEQLEDSQTQHAVQQLAAACGSGDTLHLVVAAECMLSLGPKLSEWKVDPEVVHVT